MTASPIELEHSLFSFPFCGHFKELCYKILFLVLLHCYYLDRQQQQAEDEDECNDGLLKHFCDSGDFSQIILQLLRNRFCQFCRGCCVVQNCWLLHGIYIYYLLCIQQSSQLVLMQRGQQRSCIEATLSVQQQLLQLVHSMYLVPESKECRMSATNNHNYAEKNVNMNPTIFLSIKPLLKEMATAQYSIYIYYFLSYLAIEQRFLVCFIF